MELQQNNIQYFREIYENIKSVLTFLSQKDYTALNHATINLLGEAKRETHKIFSKSIDLTEISLATRNIFEVYLILLHIRDNEKALKNWYGQSHKDSKDVRDGFITLMEKKGLDTSELKEIQEYEDKSLDESPFQSKGGFQIRNLADRYNHLDDYLFVYKLSSKLIHPSSMKVMAYDVLTENEKYFSLVVHIAKYFSSQLNNLMQTIVDEFA